MDNEAVMLHEQQCHCFGCSFVKEKLMEKMFKLKQIENIESLSMVSRIKVEHMKPYDVASNIVLRAMVYTENFWEPSIQFFVKIPNAITLATMRPFINEILFYQILQEKFTVDIVPKWYMVHLYDPSHRPYEQTIIVLENLIAHGFIQYETKLNPILLRKYIIGLALFHANTMRIQKECSKIFNFFMMVYSAQDEYEVVKQQQAISAFLNSPVMKNKMYPRDKLLKEKIIEKLKKMKHLEESSISILNHGSCTRFHIFYKEENDSQFILKFIDFQTLKLGSPVIDFGRILFTNLPNENNTRKLVIFCRELLSIYTTTLREIHPEVICELWEQNIINNLFFSYINLDTEEKEAIKNHKTILLVLNCLGSFD